MAWSKKHSILIGVYSIVLITVVYSGNCIRANNESISVGLMLPNSSNMNDSLWSDKQWQESKKTISYTEKELQEEKMETERETLDNESFSSRMFSLLTSSLARIIALVLVIGILVLVIVRLVLSRIPDKKLTSDMTDISMWFNEDELPPESDLDHLLRIAISSKNFKNAVRILYISIIRQLGENGHITWKKDKTNYDYLLEMEEQDSFPIFKDLTLFYETVWYGDHPINSEEFNIIQSRFIQFKTSINSIVE